MCLVKNVAGASRTTIGPRGAVGLGIAAPVGFLVRADAAKEAKKRKKRSSRKNGRKNKEQSAGDGRDVVRVAKKHTGARYTGGGSSPKGFDCSGFTWYVYQNATGMDISQSVEEQWNRGRSVGRNAWKPGDIVFFKNTFEHGLSHNGISIGGDEFLYAENERSGVVISSLKSDYYNEHYAVARRVL